MDGRYFRITPAHPLPFEVFSKTSGPPGEFVMTQNSKQAGLEWYANERIQVRFFILARAYKHT